MSDSVGLHYGQHLVRGKVMNNQNKGSGSRKNGSKKKPTYKEGDRFINPYNFVPLENECKKGNVEAFPSNSLTGFLECTLTVLTPLFIPNTSNDRALNKGKEDDRGKSYDFYSYTDLSAMASEEIINNPSQPVIPGSEIRGTIRSVHEAAFNSCMSSINMNDVLGRRSPTPKKPGILEKISENRWQLRECERVGLKVINSSGPSSKDVMDRATYNKYEEGAKLYIKLSDSSKKTGEVLSEVYKGEPEKINEYRIGYLHKGEFFVKKRKESIFVEKKDSEVEPIEVSADDIKRLSIIMEQYRDETSNKNAKNKKGSWYPGYSLDKKLILVYYQVNEDSSLYMAPACISREIFVNDIKEILEQNGGYQPCDDRSKVCTTCGLFGMIAKSGKLANGMIAQGRVSRVRFEDAILLKPPVSGDVKNYFMPPITLPEMGQPKPGSVEFYTIPPEIKAVTESKGYWTYDYKIPREKPIRLKSCKPQIRGRKFYWHNNNWRNYKNCDAITEMRQRIRPLWNEKGDTPIEFSFKIYFEHITSKELSELCWVLDFEDPNCAHKMGRAKPLGFGSVRIGIDKISIRDIDLKTGVWNTQELKKDELLKDFPIKINETMEALKLMMTFDNKFADVSYPKVEVINGSGNKNDEASHQWFTWNRTELRGANVRNPGFARVLPSVREECSAYGKDVDKNQTRWLYTLIKTIASKN